MSANLLPEPDEGSKGYKSISQLVVADCNSVIFFDAIGEALDEMTSTHS